MDSLQWFILALLLLVSLNHAHARIVRSKLIRSLQDEGKSAKDIAEIIRAYKED